MCFSLEKKMDFYLVRKKKRTKRLHGITVAPPSYTIKLEH